MENDRGKTDMKERERQRVGAEVGATTVSENE